MKIYLQGLTALAYYRNGGTATEVEHCPRSIRSMESATSSLNALVDAGIWRLGIGEPSIDHPFEVLLRNDRQRTRSKAVRARVWNSPVAPTAFRTVRKDVYVSSPEFTFLQMATRLDLPELIALGMELCGTYRREVRLPHPDTDEIRLTTKYQQTPLTTIKRLEGFLGSMKHAPGCRRALKALEYVLPNSASPMETVLYLLLCLPRRLGGYAIPKPTLNPPMTISKAGRQHTLKRSAKPDLYWSAIHLDLEYNSDEFHDENQRAIDSMRRKALERMKVEVVELTRDELLSVELFHATALRIARRLKRRIRSEQEGSFAERRLALRLVLLKGAGATKPDEGKAPGSIHVGDSFVTSTEHDEVSTDEWDIWIDQASGDEPWSEEAWSDAEGWEAELSDWGDRDLYVFGGGRLKGD